MMFSSWLEEIHQPSISEDDILNLKDISPKRICFNTTHKNALTREDGPNWVGHFKVPFLETIGPIFTGMTGLKLYKDNFGRYWRSIKDEQEFNIIKNWIDDVENIVFIRSYLALSIALSEYIGNEAERTEIGHLEYEAKYNKDKKAIIELVKKLLKIIKKLPYFINADYICAVPPSSGKDFDLPSVLAKGLCQQLNKINLTPDLKWEHYKKSLKSLPLDKKLEALKDANLIVSNTNLNGKKVLIIDDLYQSGYTVHYVGMKLLEKGVSQVYNIALVKSRRDSDNLQMD